MRMDKLQLYLKSDLYIKAGERQSAFLDLVTGVGSLFAKKPKKAVEGYLEALAELVNGGNQRGGTKDRSSN